MENMEKKEMTQEELKNVAGGNRMPEVTCPDCGATVPVSKSLILQGGTVICHACGRRIKLS